MTAAVDAAEEETSSNPGGDSTDKGPVIRGSPMGNMILGGIVLFVGLIYLYVQWAEKMKTHKVHTLPFICVTIVSIVHTHTASPLLIAEFIGREEC